MQINGVTKERQNIEQINTFMNTRISIILYDITRDKYIKRE
jgi:hypothetical protein